MIDERKLIKEIKDWQKDIYDNEYNASKFDFIFERIYELFDEQQKVGEWIPVSESLPEDYTWVLATIDYGEGIRDVRSSCYFRNGKWLYGSNVLAWQPLPEQYTGD